MAQPPSRAEERAVAPAGVSLPPLRAASPMAQPSPPSATLPLLPPSRSSASPPVPQQPRRRGQGPRRNRQPPVSLLPPAPPPSAAASWSRLLSAAAAAPDRAAAPASLFSAAVGDFLAAGGLEGALLEPGGELEPRRGLADPAAARRARDSLEGALYYIGAWARGRNIRIGAVYVELLGQLEVEGVAVYEDFALTSEARVMPDGSIAPVAVRSLPRFAYLRDVEGNQVGPDYPGPGGAPAARAQFDTWLFWWTLVLVHFAPPLFGLGPAQLEPPPPSSPPLLPAWNGAVLAEGGAAALEREAVPRLARRFGIASTFLAKANYRATERLRAWGCLPLSAAGVVIAGRLETLLAARMTLPWV